MMWIVWILVIIVLVWQFMKAGTFGNTRNTKPESPLEILKRKYANGEITAEEYEQKKKILEND